MAIYTERWSRNYALNTITELELTTSQSIERNSTTVKYVVRVKKINNYNDNWTPSSGGSYTTLTIGGKKVLNNYRSNWSTAGGGANITAVVASGSVEIPHNPDGSKIIDYHLIFNPNVAVISNISDRVIKGSFTANTIPRTSNFSVANSINTGENYTLQIQRHSSNFTHRVTYSIGNTIYTVSNNATTSAVINVSHDIFASHPNTDTVRSTITVTTMSGNTTIGSRTMNINIVLHPDFKPSLVGVSITTDKYAPFTMNNQLIRGVSRLKVRGLGAEGVYSSSISFYEFTYRKHSKDDYESGVISRENEYLYQPFDFPDKESELIDVAVRVRDSRNRASEWTIIGNAARVHYYQTPSIGAMTISRVGDDNQTLQVNRNYEVASLQGLGEEGEMNAANLRFQTRKLNSVNVDENKGARSTMLSLTDSPANLEGEFHVGSSFEIRAVLSDKLNTVYGSWITVGTDFASIDIGPKGVGIGKYHSDGEYNLELGEGGLSTEGPLFIKDTVEGGNVSPISSIYSPSNGVLIDICSGDELTNMIVVEVVGHGYNLNKPISTVFQTYHHSPQGRFINSAQTNLSAELPTGIFMVHDGRVKLWFEQADIYNTYIIKAYGEGGRPYSTKVTNQSKPTQNIIGEAVCTLNASPWSSSNQGKDSGLDADMLGGVSHNNYAKADDNKNILGRIGIALEVSDDKIAPGTDWNDIRESGIYYNNSSKEVATMRNGPPNNIACMVQVINLNGFIYQEANDMNNTKFMRRWYGYLGTWSSWDRIGE